MLNRLTESDFAARVNERFEVVLGDGEKAGWELVEVQQLSGDPTAEGSRRPFSIVFRAPNPSVPLQGIYRMEHAALGVMELFLVPIGPDGNGDMRYEAVFN